MIILAKCYMNTTKNFQGCSQLYGKISPVFCDILAGVAHCNDKCGFTPPYRRASKFIPSSNTYPNTHLNHGKEETS